MSPNDNSRVKRADKPIQAEVNRSFNLKEIFKETEEEKVEVENFDGKPKTEFTQAGLMEAWVEFLDKLKEENKIPAYNALQSGEVNLKDDFLIEFEFNSGSLQSEFDEQREQLMLFLRERLNNYGLEFSVVVKENTQVNFIKTKADIFKEMAEKNPNLLKLKDELGLDYNSNE